MVHNTSIRALLTLLSSTAIASLSYADISTVDDSGGADFTDIQAAINAASDGDTILVRDGTYAGFLIDNRALNVVAEIGAAANITSTVVISNLAQNKRLVLSGLSVTGAAIFPESAPATAMNVNTGSVRVQSCTFFGGAGVLPPVDDEDFGSGGAGADLFHCTDLAFIGCTIRGGAGSGHNCCVSLERGGDGGLGVLARISAVSLYDCTVSGGNGGRSPHNSAGDGATAYHAPTGGFFASGSSFTGGNGGFTDDFLFPHGGDGGHGILVGTNANVHLLDNQYVGGAFGAAPFGFNGQPGVGISGSGIIEQLSGAHRTCTAQRIAAPASQLAITITGQPGDQVFLPSSPHSYFRYRMGLHGTWLIRIPALTTVNPIGVIPASGTLQTQIPLASLPAGADAALTIVQGLMIDTVGDAYLGSPMHVLRK